MKKYSHSRQYGARLINWRVVVISAVLLWCAVAGSYSSEDKVFVQEQKVFMKPIVVEVKKEVVKVVVKKDSKATIEEKIQLHFPINWQDFIQIAHAESQMNPKAVGYNCYYSGGKATTTRIKGGSKACKVADRALFHSLDCGLMQMNTKAKKCDEKDVDIQYIDDHLTRAAELSRMQGKCAWYGYAKWEKECRIRLVQQ